MRDVERKFYQKTSLKSEDMDTEPSLWHRHSLALIKEFFSVQKDGV
jgi:hypothetical protein